MNRLGTGYGTAPGGEVPQAVDRSETPTVLSPPRAVLAAPGRLPGAKAEPGRVELRLQELLTSLKEDELLGVGAEPRQPLDAQAIETKAYQHFLGCTREPLYAGARREIYEPTGTVADGIPCDMERRETFAVIARGANHLLANEAGQDRALTLDTPTVKIVAVADGIGSVRGSERSAEILVHMAVLAAEEVSGEALSLNQSTATREFGAALNARLVRKLVEGLNQLGCSVEHGARLLGSATLNVGITTPFEGTQWAIGDGFSVNGPDTKKTSDITGRTRLDKLLVEIDDHTLELRKPLAAAASSVWLLLQQLSGAGELGAPVGPAARTAARVFGTPAGELLRESLRKTFPIDTSTPRGADAYLAAVYGVLHEHARPDELQDLEARFQAESAPGRSAEQKKALAVIGLTNGLLCLESAEGLQLVCKVASGEIDGDVEEVISSDGLRFIDDSAGDPERTIATTQRNSFLRREWLARQPPEAAAEVVELWNRLAVDRWVSPVDEAKRTALQEVAAAWLAKDGEDPSMGALEEFTSKRFAPRTNETLEQAVERELSVPERAAEEAAAEGENGLESDLPAYRKFRAAFEQELATRTAEKVAATATEGDPKRIATHNCANATARLAQLGVHFEAGMPPLCAVWDDLGFAGVRAKP